MIRPLRFFPDPVLHIPASTAAVQSVSVKKLVRDLLDTLSATPGVGLAAPQIGVSERVAVVDVSRDRRKTPRPGSNHGLLVLINPRIVSFEGVQVPREGCLSVPDLLADVRRAEKIRFESWEEGDQNRIYEATGFEALAVQHEIDHLDGKLFLDRVANLKTDLFRRKS